MSGLPAGLTPLLTQEQAATYLAIKPSTLKTYRTRGGGPVATMCGRSVRYKVEDLDAWTQREARTAAPEVTRRQPRRPSDPAPSPAIRQLRRAS